MADIFVIVNCGSSSVKLALFDGQSSTPIASILVENLQTAAASLKVIHPEPHLTPLPLPADHGQAIRTSLDLMRRNGWLNGKPAGIGHRVVHGGETFTDSAIIDPDVKQAIERCVPLAPLHNPGNLIGIDLMTELFQNVPQVAVFDTAFHQSLPQQAFLYAVPYRLYENYGVRRYGFHGTSHRFMLTQLARDLGQPEPETSLISAHLGNGCSITAIERGMSVDTSMGLTPLEGLVMGTRSGDVDPGLFDFLAGQGQSLSQTHEMLNRQSGLLGLSGLSNDMRTLQQAETDGDLSARRAIDVFCFRLARYVAAMMASLSHLDALVFTGGIGENSAEVRSRTVSHLAMLGFRLNEEANGDHGRTRQGEIQADGSHRIKVIPTNEELVIARDTQRLIGRRPRQPAAAAISPGTGD